MNKAEEILFGEVHNSQCFFESKTELANLLISNNESHYYCPPDDTPNYSRAINKIKAYLSQLFSYRTSRIVTNVFIESIKKVLIAKGKFEKNYIDEQIDLVKSLLIETNQLSFQKKEIQTILPKKISQDFIAEVLSKQINSSKYILLIAARPYEYLNSPYYREKKIFDAIINKLVTSFKELIVAIKSNTKPNCTKFSINVPNERIASRFWNELSDILIERLKPEDQNYVTLLCKTLNYGEDDEYGNALSDKTINNYRDPADTILNYLDLHFLFQVYKNELPIFSVPMIVLNPNYPPTSAYYLLDNGHSDSDIFTLGDKGIESWKENVWDTVKSSPKGEKVSFNSVKK